MLNSVKVNEKTGNIKFYCKKFNNIITGNYFCNE